MKYSILLLPLLLVACATEVERETFDPTPRTVVITETNYPEFPNIDIPRMPNLIPWEYDFPRDKTEIVVKNTTDCREVEEENRDDSFWRRCGEHPIIVDPNIAVTLSQEDFDILQRNWALIEEHVIGLRARLNEINRQRADWRERAESERQRVREERERLENN